MALPTNGNVPPRRPNGEGNQRPSGGLPKLPPVKGLPVAPPARTSSGLPSQPAPRRPSAPEAPVEPRTEAASEPSVEDSTPQEIEPGWAIDPRTGIKHRTLAPNDPEAVKAFEMNNKKGLSLEQMRRYTKEVDFDVDDLNGMAEDFLGHLRVAPSKEEIRQMREERERKMRAAAKNLEREADQDDAEFGR